MWPYSRAHSTGRRLISSALTILSPQIQQVHAAFLEATAARFGCESCDTLVGRTKPRPTFSHHLRRYFTSSRSCSAYWSVRSLCACPIHIFSRSHGTRFPRSQDARKRRKMWKPHFSLPIFFRIGCASHTHRNRSARLKGSRWPRLERWSTKS